MKYDALLVVSFGGPEGPDEVMPFLENVLRGRNVPRERMLEVAEHYQHFGGISPINAQNRELVAKLRALFAEKGPQIPVYWGNRNWHPLLPDTLEQMARDGVKHALGFFTSAYSSYSGCRQYRENLVAARAVVGSEAPTIDKLRAFFNHPGFIQPMVENVSEALNAIPETRRAEASLVFTAHSIPLSMADSCQYVPQLQEAVRLVAQELGRTEFALVYQSRSGPPSQPWLEPDIGDFLRQLSANQKARDVVVVPIGFVSDHMEILFDLDTEAQQICQELGLNMVRAKTVGTHPRFIEMIRSLVLERMEESPHRLALGTKGASHDVCPADCCPAPRRP
jgi:protoporphyrin/coproporphyrin ferrochelatase